MCVWVEDADEIEMNEKALDIVYRNNRVSNFLDSPKKLGILGIKGQGKTFLLKVKRSLAEKEDSIDCLPKNLMVDQIDNSIRLHRSLHRFMEDFNNWVSLWKVAIALTIIGYEKKNILNAPEALGELLNIPNKRCRTSVYVNHLLKKPRKDLKSILDYTSILLESLNDIHSAVYIFIDKIDQAFSQDIHRIQGDSKMSRGPQNASYWQYCQYALAQASYDITTNINSHIKVYYSIR